MSRRLTSKAARSCSSTRPPKRRPITRSPRSGTARTPGIRVSSFALIEDYFYLSLVNFVEEMARVSHGVAAYCSTDDIGNLVFDSFIGGRRTRRREH